MDSFFENEPPQDAAEEEDVGKEAEVVVQPPQVSDLNKIDQVFIYFYYCF